jgi:hypothetical protein
MSDNHNFDSNDINIGTQGRSVLQLIEVMQELVTRGMHSSNVTAADWDRLEPVVAREDFLRVGPFHDALDWNGYTAMLSQWVNSTEGWRPVIRELWEASGAVFVRCEEMLMQDGTEVPFYSLSSYRFNADNKIDRILVYMQHDTPDQGG